MHNSCMYAYVHIHNNSCSASLVVCDIEYLLTELRIIVSFSVHFSHMTEQTPFVIAIQKLRLLLVMPVPMLISLRIAHTH